MRAVVLDVEGTTTPVAFVHAVLFPFARARLPALLRERSGEPGVAAALAEVAALAPGDPLSVLLGWMDVDSKAAPLKALQGMVWREGYESGALRGAMYPDVAPALRRWAAAGVRLFVYSSGSVEAQRLIFGHSEAGDLAGLFSGFFDTRVGGKREAASYRAIVGEIGVAFGAGGGGAGAEIKASGSGVGGAGVVAGEVLFLSDVEAELDAAGAAGLATCQVVRAEDGTVASGRHRVEGELGAVGVAFGLG